MVFREIEREQHNGKGVWFKYAGHCWPVGEVSSAFCASPYLKRFGEAQNVKDTSSIGSFLEILLALVPASLSYHLCLVLLNA